MLWTSDHADAGHRHLADLELVGILDHAVHRRPDVGAGKVKLRLVDRGLGLRDLRLLARRDAALALAARARASASCVSAV